MAVGHVRERLTALHELEAWIETPMILLSFAWLVIVVADLIWGPMKLLTFLGTAIWGVFVLEFALRLILAPGKLTYLRRNWLTLLALLAPALRMLAVFRFLRFARAARGLRLVRIIGTANRGMNALRHTMRRRGLGYVSLLTGAIGLLGAAGMLAFEPAARIEGGFTAYGDALWWTAMLLTTIGTDFWPQTVEGRILCFLLSVYAFAVWGYITASIASFFLGQDSASNASRSFKNQKREVESR